jgi:osmotically-inducible protein OsmY
MSTRYSDQDLDRAYGPDYDRYGRRSDYASGSYREPSPRSYRNYSERQESDYDRYGREGYYGNRYGSDYGYDFDYERRRYGTSRNEPYSARDYDYGRDRYGYGYSEPSSRYSEGYNYPSGYRSAEAYGSRYRRGDQRGYEGRVPEERGWWDRASDEVASWFGDEEAERRRRMDDLRRLYRGLGPRSYRRSDERIREDVNDRFTDDPYLDASDIDVSVSNCEVTLSGTVDNRTAKRRAEDIAEWVSGVTNVQNNLRASQEGTIRGRTTGTSAETTEPTSAARTKSAAT